MEPWSEEPRRRFTVDEVTQMLRAGILDEDDRIELIEGELLVMSPNDPPHANTVDTLQDRLTHLYGPGARVRAQLPLDVSAANQPEPDLVVARGDTRTYAERHPRGSDCILIVEVSWSSRQRDFRKAGLYAGAGVAVYWILDLELRRLHVHEGPKPDGTYTHVHVLDAGDDVEQPETNVRWKISDLLPPS